MSNLHAIAFEEKVQILLVNYNNSAPWNVNKDNTEGLNVELANFLNRDKKSPYTFKPEFYPRKRVDYLLEKKDVPMVIAWVNQKFFPNDFVDKFYWTKNITEDFQVVGSNKNKIVEYQNLESLVGKKFSAVFGTRYKTLDPYIRKGKIIRVDSYRFDEALTKVIGNENSLDFFILENSFLQYLKKRNNILFSNKNIYIAKQPFSPPYGRHLMVAKSNKMLFQYLNAKIEELNIDKDWKKILREYGQSNQE